MRATERAPRDPFRLLERRHGLAEIVESRTGVHEERPRVNFPYPERKIMTLTDNASRHWQRFAHQCLGIFETTSVDEPQRVADRFSNGFFMFIAYDTLVW